ncbi:MAG: serine hydrolase [Oceanicaulis sp.]
MSASVLDLPAQAGLAAALLLGGQTKVRVQGFADAAAEIPVTAQTRFRVCSLTKPMTALAALRLGEVGRLDLDAPIAHWFGSAFPQAVTVRSLMDQSSGLRDQYILAMLSGAEAETRIDREANARLCTALAEPMYRPGSGFAYANTNFYLLGEIIERVAETDLDAALRALIFYPAGMETAALEPETALPVTNGATGFEPGPDGGPVPAIVDLHWRGDAGVCASLDDMVQFFTWLNGPEDWLADLIATGSSRRYRYGVGVESPADGTGAAGHEGALRGFRSAIRIDRDRAAIVLSNAMIDAGGAARRLMNEAPPAAPQGRVQRHVFDPVSGLAFGLGDGVVTVDGGRRSSDPDTFGERAWRVQTGSITSRGDSFSAQVSDLSDEGAGGIEPGRYENGDLRSTLVIEDHDGVRLAAFEGPFGRSARRRLRHLGRDDWSEVALVDFPRGVDHFAPGAVTLSQSKPGRITLSHFACRNVVFERTSA